MWHGILEDALVRSYKTEVVGEYLYYNKGLLDMDTFDVLDFSDEISTLIKDSKKHKDQLEEIFSNLELPLLKYFLNKEVDVYGAYFAKAGLGNEEILSNLVINEDLMIDFYREMKRKLTENTIGELWSGEEVSDFFRSLNSLISSEEEHQGIKRNLLKNKDFLDRLGAFETNEIDKVTKAIDVSENNIRNSIEYGFRDNVIFKTRSDEIIDHLDTALEKRDFAKVREKIDLGNQKVIVVEVKAPLFF